VKTTLSPRISFSLSRGGLVQYTLALEFENLGRRVILPTTFLLLNAKIYYIMFIEVLRITFFKKTFCKVKGRVLRVGNARQAHDV